jgi:hypothetical protein
VQDLQLDVIHHRILYSRKRPRSEEDVISEMILPFSTPPCTDQRVGKWQNIYIDNWDKLPQCSELHAVTASMIHPGRSLYLLNSEFSAVSGYTR